ncbi:hypothetical protein [Spartinivicinus poritis]|uniref:Uncharacterized protein n=1 Tax=Spartinivicinus poritis TaxID=2994640 RepID=A0ABT5U7C8_9GAMM|nr:hypothetical protein [Spartinivicinus sp. A2-2]MDE1462227.1 hypothetical protein [Spartinivicinus sp. A2-2]
MNQLLCLLLLALAGIIYAQDNTTQVSIKAVNISIVELIGKFSKQCPDEAKKLKQMI